MGKIIYNLDAQQGLGTPMQHVSSEQFPPQQYSTAGMECILYNLQSHIAPSWQHTMQPQERLLLHVYVALPSIHIIVAPALL